MIPSGHSIAGSSSTPAGSNARTSRGARGGVGCSGDEKTGQIIRADPSAAFYRFNSRISTASNARITGIIKITMIVSPMSPPVGVRVGTERKR